MKKGLSVVLCLAMIVLLMPPSVVKAISLESSGTIVPGEEYCAVAELDEGGNPIPERYEFTLDQDSIVRIFLYTQEDSDSSFTICSQNSPYESSTNYGSFVGNDLTVVNDSYNPKPNVFSISSYGFTAYKGNTKEYTELFGSLNAGDYYVVLHGASYDFMLETEPLLYQGNHKNPNDTKENAASYTIGSDQNGVLIDNGIIDNNFIDYAKMQNSWYKFTADAGSYRLSFKTDGFFQGYCAVVNSDGYAIGGNEIKAEAYYKFDGDEPIAGTYEEHLKKAGTYNVDFTLPEKGTYYINVNRRIWTSGSYQFKITEVDDVSKITASKETLKIKVGGTATNKIMAYYSNGTSKNVTDQATYKASSASLKISSNGELKASKRGTYKVTVTYKGKKTTFKIVVR